MFRSHGGPDEPWNLISLCKHCHGRAHGLDSPKLKRDLLHSMVAHGVSGNVIIPECRTCRLRDANYVCRVDGVTREPDYSCPLWEEN